MKFGTVTQIGPLQGTDRYNFDFFFKTKMAAVTILKNHKNAISQQPIDRISQNMARL